MLNQATIKIAHININGLESNFECLRAAMTKFAIDICFCTETWLTETSDIPSDLVIIRSILPRTEKQSRGTKGVAVVVSSPLLVKQLNICAKYISTNGDSIWLTINGTLIGCLYMTPQLTDIQFKNTLQEETSRFNDDNLVLVGDLNARSATLTGDKKTNQKGRALEDFLSSQDMKAAKPISGLYTYREFKGKSVPDYIITKGNVDLTEYNILDNHVQIGQAVAHVNA